MVFNLLTYKNKTNQAMELATNFAQFFEKNKVLDNVIFYECRDGKSMTDSPYAIFKYLITDQQYNDYIHVWSVDEGSYGWDFIKEKYGTNKNVKFVERNSDDYLFYLTSSKYLITNSTFQSYFVPKKEQVCVNTWHGIPIKKMGYDIQSGNPGGLQNVVRNFFFADILASPNQYMTDMYKYSFKLRDAYEGDIIETGYPRMDLTNNSFKDTITQELLTKGLQIDEEKKNILYCPTWKGTDVNKPTQEIDQIVAESDFLRNKLADEYNLLIKVHPFLYPEARKSEELSMFLIPDYFDPNEVMSCIDLLITDYSSIFFDFLKTNKPIIFYCWDKEIYENDRGLYITEENLPGPVVKTVREVVEKVKNIEKVNEIYQNNYQKMIESYLPYEDGNSTKRLVEYMLADNCTPIIGKVVGCKDFTKQTLLVYVGGMKNNGITSSVVNLLKNIDYKRYDVTCFTGFPRTKEIIANIRSIPDNVRFIYKPGYAILTPRESKLLRRFNKKSNEKNQKLIPWYGLKREASRIFSNRSFDLSIDFSGYSFFWAKYILASQANTKICFLHSDMLADKEREVNGKKIHEKNLLALFYNYVHFDKLLTVSPIMKKINYNKLKRFIGETEISYTINTLDIDKLFGEREGVEENFPVFSSEDIDLICENDWFYLYDSWDSESSMKKLATRNSSIKAVMSVELENETRYKVMMDDVYIGWVSSLQFTRKYFQIKETKKVDEYGYVKRNSSRFLWIDLPISKEARLVGKIKDYQYLLLHIDEKTELENGQVYLHLVKDGEILGWAEENSISFAKHNIFLRKIKNKYSNRNKLQRWDNRILETVNEDGFVWIQTLPYEDKWNASIMFKSLSTPLINFLGKPFKYTMKVNTKDGWYYRLWGDYSFLGWVSERNIVRIHEQQIISSYEISAKITLNKPRAYRTIDREEEIHLESDNYFSYEKLITTKEIFYVVDQYYLIPQDNIKKIVTYDKNELPNKDIAMVETTSYNIVTMGRLSPEKKQSSLIRAFEQVRERHPEVKLYLLGDGPMKKELLLLVQELNLTDSVFLLGHQDDPFELLKQCQLFVLTSDYEGQPMVLLEAMAVGLPVASTDIPATRYVLDNGKLGILAEDNSVPGIERMIEKAYKSDLRSSEFDAYEYNKEAMAMFYAEIGGNKK
ncbi:hypothetical protein TH5N_19820 [Tetragenococcus halophilus]|uniref:CDP-glycerol glycerophosphotransferase family protein n=1 Tax=Tetragenococcus halophilus TaxID=51669 RepID=UPI001925F60B|nr:CDP-glycerol glycerophosphotransferase family protein [Tetragenococcus halophilus]MDN6749587.1 CDP-glycerol glycerophosphotransferase family protein [Staphylococcus equorum]GEQ38839.1 hypothetical protein TH3N_19650 [Tetragenococcus halophilus]GEQ41104.1 hypothetical protein TH5N_19820 [Tetragenococcus halophilus]GEQ43356.1 hypothetical protein TH6N_19820 [Tetragenococcus halophilus]GEQ45601.1 hypothetical protein TH8N_19710 [Tetragenococcus halophilus]